MDLGALIGGMAMEGIAGAIEAGQNEKFNNKYRQGQQDWYRQAHADAAQNSMGQTGKAAGTGVQNALRSLSNSGEAVQASYRNNQLAGNMLSQPQQVMGAASKAAGRALSAQTDSTINLAKSVGLGGAGMAALADALAQGSSQTLNQMAQTAGAQTQSAIGAASEMYSKAPSILNQDLANRNSIYVDPYKVSYGQFNPNIDMLKTDPYAGLERSMTRVGTQLQQQPFMDHAQDRAMSNYQNMGVNAGQQGKYNDFLQFLMKNGGGPN